MGYTLGISHSRSSRLANSTTEIASRGIQVAATRRLWHADMWWPIANKTLKEAVNSCGVCQALHAATLEVSLAPWS